MNFRFIATTLGKTVLITAVFLFAPLVVALIYGEDAWKGYLVAIASSGLTGALLTRFEDKEQKGGIRDGFVIVSFCWVLISVFGALPFVVNGSIPSFIDAFFETVSGFTTTGASIVTDFSLLSKADLFWRSLTHWLGGMGVLVLLLVFHRGNRGSLHLLRAEAPGPTVSKLVPKLGDTARTLYGIYLTLTAGMVLVLVLLGAPLFDALVLTFGTAGTGGFAMTAASLADYSVAIQWVVGICMILFGINFSVYYLIMTRRLREVFRHEETKVYLAIVVATVALITWNIYGMYEQLGTALKDAVFQVASVVSTTGFATADFNLWPTFSKMILVTLMLMGASAGSTAGGLKVARVMILFQSVRNRIIELVRPNLVTVVKFEGKRASDEQVRGVGNYLTVYVSAMIASMILLALEGFDFETTTTAVIACFNNIGPGLGLVGPAGGYAMFGDFGKLLLSFNMLFGRLEIYPLLIAFTYRGWRR
ncbi:MAG: TrkH family potassium uptake protein [Bacillota bacterium]|nr:TrkH family potassium uptake protein [Bacillota bacterium]